MPLPALVLRVNRILLLAALAIFLGYFAGFGVYAVNLMQFPFDYDQGEGFELVDTILFSQGRWPYQDTEIYPFYSSNYPPLFHILAAPFVWLFGPAYWYGRLLGTLATMVTAAAIGFAVYRDGHNRLVAVLSGMALLASNTIYHIGPLFRQHMTMVMFETLAVVVLAHVNEIPDTGKRRWALVVGLALVLAAGYTKQLALATAIAVVAFLFIRQPRRGIISTASFGAVGVAIFLWMNAATQGQWWLQTIAANVNTYIADQAIGLFRLWFSLHGFLLVPAALYVVYELYFDRLSLYSLWFIAATANSVLSGKWGAGDSYFATAIAGLCMLSGLFASRTLVACWTFPENYLSRLFVHRFRQIAPQLAILAAAVVPLLYLGYGRAVFHMPTEGAIFGTLAQAFNIQPNAHGNFYDSAGRIAGGYADIGHLTTQSDLDAGHQIVSMIRETELPVLGEDAGFNLAAGKDVVTNPTQLLNLANNGSFEGSGLIEMLVNQEFGLVILRASFYPEPVLEAIHDAYMPTETIHMNGFDYVILRPDER
jgi:4-amino-4-deoxy-L-arabinose transferase-like glycosyltransferase